MNIVVIGAGIVGLTSAHALNRAGHAVTVLDSQPQAVMGCSQANGGFLSPSHCAPWAAPGLARLALKCMFDPVAPMRWRPDFSIDQWRWIAALLGQASANRFALNRARMLALARYSRECHDKADAELGFSYARHHDGVLQLCRSAAGMAAMQRQRDALRADGVDAVWRSREETLQLEPALDSAMPDLLGALHIIHEGAGSCESHGRQLAQHLARQGVRFEWNATVDGFEVLAPDGSASSRKLHSIRVKGQTLNADACVVAAGPDTAKLLARHLRVPIYPVKGYSMTAPIAERTAAPRRAVIDERSKLAIAAFDNVVRVAGFADVVGYDLRLDSARCQQLVAGFDALYPGVADTRNAQFWAGLRPMTPDGTPIVGATGIKGLYLNSGHGTYGWTLSHGSAQLVAECIDGKNPTLNPADYALSRFKS
jgi:D-amino-acid dehydrogenase